MKFEAGKHRYSFSGDRLEGAWFWLNDPETHPGEPAYAMQTMPAREMVKRYEDEKTKELKARPLYISVVINELWLWPKPDTDVTARVRYSTIHEM